MPNLLNYKYEIFPTKPQKAQLYRILRESKYQWNKAVTIRKKLKAALVSGQIEYVIKTCLSSEKDNRRGRQPKDIQEFLKRYPDMDFDTAASCYKSKQVVGDVLGNLLPEKLLDVKYLVEEFKARYKEEAAKRKEAKAKGVENKKLPKLTVFWQLIRAINNYAGYEAKDYIDKSFESPKGMSLSTIRSHISGYKESKPWNTAVKPSNKQRTYGAIGEPNYKKRCDGFSYQIQGKETSDIFRNKRRNIGHQILINPLHKENAWIDAAYHRPIPEGSKIKQMTINERAGHFFAVLSCEVPDIAWLIAPMKAGWRAGIDPGETTALTVAFHNTETSEIRQAVINYQFLEKGLKKLEKIKQSLAKKQGPRRKRTGDEVKKELTQFSLKRSIQKLPEQERNKAIAKKKGKLEKTMIRQDASNSWKKLSRKDRELNYRIANKRLDVLHKISRALVEGCDVVGIGHWEPERQVSYRKKQKALQRQVNAGIEGAKEKLKALEEEKSKQGPKGVKKIRRGGRDRAIATLRRMVEEKAKRTGTIVYPDINEAGSTFTCSNCGAETGPRGDLSVRGWRCTECNTLHQRDLNSGFNILNKTNEEYAAAQAAASETSGHTATRTMAHGTTVQSGSNAGFRVRGSSMRGGSLFYQIETQNAALSDLWQGEVPKAFKSLIEMGIARSLTMQDAEKNALESPP